MAAACCASALSSSEPSDRSVGEGGPHSWSLSPSDGGLQAGLHLLVRSKSHQCLAIWRDQLATALIPMAGHQWAEVRSRGSPA